MNVHRRQAIGLGVVTATAAFAASAVHAAPSQTLGGPQAEPEDAWLDQGGHRHRIVFDTLSAAGLGLGSGLIDQSQKMTVAAMQIADMKVWAHRS